MDAGGVQVHTSAFKNRTKSCMKKQRRWRNRIPNGRWVSDKELSLVTKPFQGPLYTVAQDCFLLSTLLPLHPTKQVLQEFSQRVAGKYLPHLPSAERKEGRQEGGREGRTRTRRGGGGKDGEEGEGEEEGGEEGEGEGEREEETQT